MRRHESRRLYTLPEVQVHARVRRRPSSFHFAFRPNSGTKTLKDTAQRIAGGETPVFDEAAVVQMAAEFAELRKHVPPRPLGCLIFQWTLIALVGLLAAVVVYLYWYVRHGR